MPCCMRMFNALASARSASTRGNAMPDPTAARLGPRTPQAVLVSLLPLAAGQAYVILLVSIGNLNYFQALVVNLPEIWLASLSSMLFFSRSREVLRKRAVKLFAMTGAALVLSLLLLVAGTPERASGSGGTPAIFVFAGASLTADFIRQCLIYLAICLGSALLVAFISRAPARTWYQNVVLPSYIALVALFLSLVLLFVSGMRDATPQPWQTLALVCAFATLRLVLTGVIQLKSSDTQLQEDYQSFLSGTE